jgi:hypothetical protein
MNRKCRLDDFTIDCLFFFPRTEDLMNTIDENNEEFNQKLREKEKQNRQHERR